MNAVLMVAHNNLHLTKLAVASVMRQDVEPTLIVVDNASTDGTQAWLATKDIATISYTKQRSLAACWNRGLGAFWSAGAQQVLVVNNDVELSQWTYRSLAQASLPFVSGISVSSKSQLPVDPPSCPFNPRPHPDFSCFLMSAKVFDKAGPFNEDYYPAYVEDSEYHIRMHRAGIEAVCVDLPFYHVGSQTLKNSNPQEKASIARGADRNRERFRAKYGCLPGTQQYEELFKQLPLVEG